MKLSILIPSIPERREQVNKLFAKLEHQIMDRYKTVEVLMLVDNCERTIGAKRDALLKIAQGDYICFKQGTLIETRDTVKKIEEIKVGNIVKTHTGKYQKVKKVSKRYYSQRKPLIWIEMGLNTIKCTPEHPFLAIRNGKKQWIKAKGLFLTDKLLYPYKFSTDYLKLDIFAGRWKKKYYGDILVDRDLARMMGFYLAEGNSNRNGILFTFNNNETEYHNFIKKVCKEKFNRDVTIYKRWATQIVLNIRSIGVRFKEFFGSNARNKRIPAFVYKWNLINKLNFIKGYIEGDGSINKYGRNQICSVNKKLLEDFKKLCKMCFVETGRIYSYGPNTTLYKGQLIKSSEVHYCCITRKNTARIFLLTKSLFYENNLMMDIDNIKEKKQPQSPHGNMYVYNLEVEKDNSYIADNVIVHNCYVDDDDDVTDDFIEYCLDGIETGKDLIVFNHEAWINGKRYFISVDKDNPNEQLSDSEIVRRKPLHSNLWKRELVKNIAFPDIMYGEDYQWAAKALKKISTQHKFVKVLHIYKYEDAGTAASKKKTNKMNKKTCIISFCSKGREDYNTAIKRQIDSVKDLKLDIDHIVYSPDADFDEYKGVPIFKGYPLGCDSHSEVPYQFKPYLFQLAKNWGNEVIIWMDSTVQILRDPAILIKYAETNGFTVFNNLGHPVENYMADDTMEKLGIKTLKGVPQIMACVIIMDVTNDHVNRILDQWIEISNDGISFAGRSGSTRKGFVAHRHDQVILSWLLWKNNIEFLPYGQLCYPPHHESGEHEVIFLNKNM